MFQSQLRIQRCVQHVLSEPHWEQQDALQPVAEQTGDRSPERNVQPASAFLLPPEPIHRSDGIQPGVQRRGHGLHDGRGSGTKAFFAFLIGQALYSHLFKQTGNANAVIQ